MILGDLGARVIKVERPGAGDDTRSWGPPFVASQEACVSTYFLSVNRNKESVVLDLKTRDGREALLELTRRADVVVENFRDGVLARLQLSHSELLEVNPRLIVLSISGFGHKGPDAARAGYDQIVQGEAGIMSVTGPGPGEPLKVGVPIGDVMAGLYGVVGVLAALRARAATGRGCVVRTSLLAALVASHTFQGTRWLVGGEIPQASGNHHPTVAPYGTYQCRDGVIQIAIGNDALWRRFAPLIDVDPADRRFGTNADRIAHQAELDDLMRQGVAKHDKTHWLSTLADQGIPAGNIKSIDEVYEDPQVQEQGLIIEMKHPSLGAMKLAGPPVSFDGMVRRAHAAPPMLGEHTRAILAWLDQPATQSAGPRHDGNETETNT